MYSVSRRPGNKLIVTDRDGDGDGDSDGDGDGDGEFDCTVGDVVVNGIVAIAFKTTT